MNTGLTTQGRQGAFRRALTLIEIMVTVTLLVIIILGLTAMFNQTRKAFTVGLSNVDYQDAGRAAMDLISRDLQQMAPGDYGQLITSNGITYYNNCLNFYADLSVPPTTPVLWPMTGGDTTTFSMGRMLFVTAYSKQRTAVGYRLLFNDATNGVGTLYRYNAPIQFNENLYVTPTGCFQVNNFLFDPATGLNPNLSRVIDGVVDFRIRAYDRNGVLIPTPVLQYDYITTNNRVRTDTIVYTGNSSNPVPSPGSWMDANVSAFPPFVNTNVYYGVYQYVSPVANTGDYFYSFFSNAVPAYVDIELGIMETPTLQKLQAFAGTPNYAGFLTSHAAQVHIFRQRVTIPSTDPAAYP